MGHFVAPDSDSAESLILTSLTPTAATTAK